MERINGANTKRVALINDLSCFGGCSLTVSIPIVSSFGIEAVPLPTAVLSTHTTGFDNYRVFDMTCQMNRISEHWREIGISFDGIYTGYFSSIEQCDIALEFIRDFKKNGTFILVDPVMGDDGELYSGFDMEHVRAMRRLCAEADIITPNFTEARLLCGLGKDATAEQMLPLLPSENAVITGVRCGDKIGYVARIDSQIYHMEHSAIDQNLHGAGDVFASRLCAGILGGMQMKDAFFEAAKFCNECIDATKDSRPYHWYGLAFEKVLAKRK